MKEQRCIICGTHLGLTDSGMCLLHLVFYRQWARGVGEQHKYMTVQQRLDAFNQWMSDVAIVEVTEKKEAV